jgi:hypothetical protein
VIKWLAVVSGFVVTPTFYLAYARSLLTRMSPDRVVVRDVRVRQDASR